MGEDLQGLSRIGREGGQWWNTRPTGEEVSAWFIDSVPVHEGMNVEDWASGVTLIQSTEKVTEITGTTTDGSPILNTVEHVVHTPYVKVETRLRYFWALVEELDGFGVIQPVELAVVDEGPLSNVHLPPGFFYEQVAVSSTDVETFICCSMRARIFEKDSMERRVIRSVDQPTHEVIDGKLLLDAPAGTKAVPLLGRTGADPNAMMKAETGAIGRALAMAGMLVAPGSSIATAEDVAEALTAERRPSSTAVSTAPADARPEDEGSLRSKAMQAMRELEAAFPNRHKHVQAWAVDRKFSIDEIGMTGLKAVLRKVSIEMEHGAGEGDLAEPAA
jgi:hypothetical protein